MEVVESQNEDFYDDKQKKLQHHLNYVIYYPYLLILFATYITRGFLVPFFSVMVSFFIVQDIMLEYQTLPGLLSILLSPKYFKIAINLLINYGRFNVLYVIIIKKISP